MSYSSQPPPHPGWSPAPTGPAPLDQPQYDATIGQAASRFWRKFAVFSGRASRSEYWWWALISFAISIVLQLVGSVITGGSLFMNASNPTFDVRAILLPLIPSLVWSVVVIVPSLALAIRRLHDTNRSGWWYLLALPSLVGGLLVLASLRSLEPEQLALGDPSGLAFGPLIGGSVLIFVGGVGSIILLVFFILGPNPAGARFDRRG